MWLPSFVIETKHEFILKYSDLDDYYVDCMSWHDGTGYVKMNSIGNTEGTYSLTCADGHAPSDKHPIKYKQNSLIRGN
ncbi:MAG: hypothetical protein GY714_01760 [Desulfobacterales bacterium]|nr:hypothetical protein [Desulfobacterales bacterium]